MTERSRVEQLRSDFDRGFADPFPGEPARSIDLLRIRVGGEPHVISLGEIAAIVVDHRVVAMPTSEPALLGVAAVRAAIVPIYDLRVLLGVVPNGTPRWIVLAPELVAGFAFDGFDGHLRITSAPIAAAGARLLRGVVSYEGRAVPVIDLTAAVRDVTEVRTKER